MKGRAIEIICPACKAESILRREPIYDGFRKVGEKLLCSSCGHEFADEKSVPFKRSDKPRIFTEQDRVKRPAVFCEEDPPRTCRYCINYTVNPFTQRCSLTWRIVEATDTCDKFEPRQNQLQPDVGGKETEAPPK